MMQTDYPSEGTDHSEFGRKLREKPIREQLRVAEEELKMCKEIVANRIAVKGVVSGKTIATDLIADMPNVAYVSDIPGQLLDDAATKVWRKRLHVAFKKVHDLRHQLAALSSNKSHGRHGVDIDLN